MPIFVVSSDGETFSVAKPVAELSVVIQSMEVDENNEADPIPLGLVDSETLKKILVFCEYYLQNPLPTIAKPIETNDFSRIVPTWYNEYANVDYTILFKLAQAANCLDIPPLLDLVCAKIASMIKDKSVEQIRETFSLSNDLTPEEEEQMKEEYKWLEETV